MMSAAILLGLVAAAFAGVPADMSFDDIDLDKFESKEQIENFIKCMADKTLFKGCSYIIVNIRERGKDIVKTNCAECTPNEKQAVAFLTAKVAANKEGGGDLIMLLKKFDFTGKNSKSFLEGANKVPINRNVPKIPDSIINRYPDPNVDNDEPSNEESATDPSHPEFSRFYEDILGAVGSMLRGLLDVIFNILGI